MKTVAVNRLGIAVARSGLLPATAAYFLEFARRHAKAVAAILPANPANATGLDVAESRDATDVSFVLAHLCFSSPEYGTASCPPRRNIPFQLGERRESDRAIRLQSLLTMQPWDSNVLAVNASDLTLGWVAGIPVIDLESEYEKLRAGTLRDMYRTLVAHLTGLADVLMGALSASEAGELPETYAWIAKSRGPLFRIVRRARQLARCAVRGVPEDVLWLAELADDNGRALCRRPEVVACYRGNLKTLEDLLDPGRKNVLIEALRAAGGDPQRWQIIRSGAIDYRKERTARRRASQLRRLGGHCDRTVTDYYESRGIPFEQSLEQCFLELSIPIVARDDSSKRGASFPDFVIQVGGKPVVLECKSKDGNEDVSLGEVAEVFKKAGLNNFDTEPLVTVCTPYVASDVARKIEAANRLTVINAEDFAEALVRLSMGKLDQVRFLSWLTTPGQSILEEL